MAILIAEAAALALLYEAPAIAIMALLAASSLLVLHSNRGSIHFTLCLHHCDRHRCARSSKALGGLRTNRIPGIHHTLLAVVRRALPSRKTRRVLIFSAGAISDLSYSSPRWTTSPPASFDNSGDVWLLVINPFIFFASVYHLLNPSYHDWMGVFAILTALILCGSCETSSRSQHDKPR
jgi:hypothetical protein